MVDREKYMLCCDCGHAVEREKMFIKSYRYTSLCLCRKCAFSLTKEILVARYNYARETTENNS